ncbi:MAG TPA: TfuA-like protein [Allosphingosinicella sp.]|jgi:hypothetical protein|nr:TfuA-like protein [Allosphingosinicella sp.]
MIVFAGPSLAAEDRTHFPGAEWRPPAEAGDLLRLLDRPSERIVLIDGYFDHRPAPRHKEILHLLAGGAEIWGAASIGALRAAEMAPFGMIGVGAIFRAYADGRIAADDEVALAHGPAEWRWRPLSVPLVDVRATLCRAVREKVVGAAEARAVRNAAASIHYAERMWEPVLELTQSSAAGWTGNAVLRPEAIAGLRAWLPSGAVSQKRLDALACLSAAAVPRPKGPRPEAVRTLFLDLLARESGVDLDRPRAPAPAGPPATPAAPRG